jgi:murein DD-endopeptidase MepM/ murein hydrolase activator NlpD
MRDGIAEIVSRIVKLAATGLGVVAVALAIMWALAQTPASAALSSSTAPVLQFPWQEGTAHNIDTSGSTYGCGTHTGAGNTRAVDFNLSLNTPVHATAAGRATASVDPVGGNVVTIDHGLGWASEYAHLSSWTITVNGQWVGAGQRIGYSGSTGSGSLGPHLHFGLHGYGGTDVAPEPMYGPYRGGNGGFGQYGCNRGSSPFYTAQPGCPSGSSQTTFNRSTVQGAYSVAEDGGVFNWGHAPFHGSMGGQPLNAVMSGIARTYDNQGYWTVAADGGVFAFNAPFNGSTGSLNLNSCIQGLAARANGGYWLVAADGGIFGFNAPFYGSMGGHPLNARIQAMAPTPDGGGYWLVGQDGGIFAFGNAQFLGSLAGQATAPVTSIASTPSGRGYWIVQANGVVVGFGDAPNFGSWSGGNYGQVVAISPSVNGDGYWLFESDGQSQHFGNTDGGYNLYGNIVAPIAGSAGLHGKQPGLTITASPPSVLVPPGQSMPVQVTVTANPYFQGVATLSASGVPAGASVSFAANNFSLGQNQSTATTMTVRRSLTYLSSFTFTVSACGNGVCSSTNVTVS